MLENTKNLTLSFTISTPRTITFKLFYKLWMQEHMAFMVIEVCHLSLHYLLVMLPLRKVARECEVFLSRGKQIMLWALISIYA